MTTAVGGTSGAPRRGVRVQGWLFAAALAAGSCARAAQQAHGDALGSGWQRYRSLCGVRAFTVATQGDWAERAGDELRTTLERELSLQVERAPLDRSQPSATRARLVVADARAPSAAPILAALGARVIDGQRLAIGGREVELDGHALVGTLADPDLPEQSLTAFLSGASPGASLEVAPGLRPAWRSGWRLFEGTRCIAECDLDDPARPVRALESDPGRSLEEWVAEGPELASLASDRDAAWSAVAELFGPQAEPATQGADGALGVRVHLHESAGELERAALGPCAWRVWPSSREVDLLRAHWPAPREAGSAPAALPAARRPVDARAALAALFACQRLGPPSEPWLLAGFARRAAGTWWGRDLEPWQARLVLAQRAPEPEALLDEGRSAELSPHVVEPLRALLFSIVLEQRGGEALRRLWKSGATRLTEDERAAWRARLASLEAQHAEALHAADRARRARALTRPLRRGCVLVEPAGPGAERGFSSALAARSVADLAQLGADALVLRPRVFQSGRVFDDCLAAPAASSGAPRALFLDSSCGDVPLAALIGAAQASGMDVLLEPELLRSPSMSLAGEALSGVDEEWQVYFADVRRTLEHAAMLAELCGVDVLSLGAELGEAIDVSGRGETGMWDAATREELARHWRAGIAGVRSIFHGGLTYSARWPAEVESFGLWPELDFVGATLFLDRTDRAGEPDFRTATADWEGALGALQGFAAAQGKRALVSATGCSSTRDGWRRLEHPAGPADERVQARALLSLVEALSGPHLARSDLAGLMLWNWSTDPRAGGRDDRGFSIQNKVGVEALRRLFRLP